MYQAFYSLGPGCAVAASMAEYGLRSCSGPFDWIITPSFEWIVRFIENDFDGFFALDRLERYCDQPWFYKDKQSGFLFLHDFKPEDDFRQAWGAAKEKYDRRVARFLRVTKQPTCFLRLVNDEDELRFIAQNEERVRRAVQKGNPQNTLVLLAREGTDVPPTGFLSFPVPDYRTRSMLVLGTMLDGADEFLRFCCDNYSKEKMLQNLFLEKKLSLPKKLKEDEANDALLRKYNDVLLRYIRKLENGCAPQLKEAVLYGTDEFCLAFYEKLKDVVGIRAFVGYRGDACKIRGVPVVPFEALADMAGVPVIVSPAYDHESIKQAIHTAFGEETAVIGMEELISGARR